MTKQWIEVWTTTQFNTMKFSLLVKDDLKDIINKFAKKNGWKVIFLHINSYLNHANEEAPQTYCRMAKNFPIS